MVHAIRGMPAGAILRDYKRLASNSLVKNAGLGTPTRLLTGSVD